MWGWDKAKGRRRNKPTASKQKRMNNTDIVCRNGSVLEKTKKITGKNSAGLTETQRWERRKKSCENKMDKFRFAARQCKRNIIIKVVKRKITECLDQLLSQYEKYKKKITTK